MCVAATRRSARLKAACPTGGSGDHWLEADPSFIAKPHASEKLARPLARKKSSPARSFHADCVA